ncbi:MAG: cation:proton antiporter [Proteobacteria bacterium]|nr:cation:proton antiporter [Pseudomonadota bacterium]MCZ6784866.1 cation:proton antiporter [Pseudomonadota bacterium]
MNGPSFVGELLLLIAIAAAGVALFDRLRLPSIAGFLVMGALVGPGGLGWVDDPERVAALAELGVVFLLFEIGLELPLERVRRIWRRAVAAGGLQIAITVAAVAGIATGFGLAPAPAFVLGCVVAMSSTALVMRVLSDRGEIDAPQGQLSVGILLMQDLCIVPFLLVVPLLAAGTESSSARAGFEVLRALAVLTIFFLIARFVLPRLLAQAMRTGSRELFTLMAVLVVVGSAWLAEEAGLTLAVGAFIGGLVLSATPYSHQLFAEVVPLRGVLLGIFFTAVGMLLDPGVAILEWARVLVYVGAVVALKAVVVAAIVAFGLRLGPRLGVITGLGLAQTGEFSFVLAAQASDVGLWPPELQQVFIAGSIVTLIATPFLISAAPAIAQALSRGADPPDRTLEDAGAPDDHVVLLGFGLAGQTLGRVLRSRGIRYRAVEANPRAVQEARERGEPVVYGDATRRPLLERIGIARARLVVLTISDPMATREAVALARALAPDAAIVARTRYMLEVDGLYAAGATMVVAEEFESTIEVLAKALAVFSIPESAIARFAAELREEGYEPMRTPSLQLDPWLGEILEEVTTVWLDVPEGVRGDVTLADLAVRARTGASVLAVERRGETVANPPPDQLVGPGDRVLAFGTSETAERLRDLLRERAS